MSMMKIRIVRMPVHEPRVAVHMCMWLARWIARSVCMLMMLIMHMRVLVYHLFMHVLVVVSFDQMQIDSDRHQKRRA